jgi:hypothetical protein
MNVARRIGTSAETAVVKYLRVNGFPQAERRALHGALDQGDVTGTPGIVWEVKGGDAARYLTEGSIAMWLAQTEAERVNAGAAVGVLVVQRVGYGPLRAGMWLTYIASRIDDTRCHWQSMRLDTMIYRLREQGYGDPL